MKTKFKSLLSILAIVAGISATLAFASNPQQNEAWFRLDAQANPVGQALSDEPDCIENDNVHCSARYNIDAQGNPQGSALQTKMGIFVEQ